MTEFVEIQGGRIAYDVTGSGPLVVLSHGIGDRRQAYRFLAPKLAQAGYRVVSADLRGHGESSMGWKSVTGKEAISRTDIAGDLLALIDHLGGPAVIVGHSISGGAATIAAAQQPNLVSGVVEINPFTKEQKFSLGSLVRIRRYRRGGLRMMGTQLFHSLRFWLAYLDVAYPTKPGDYAEYMAALAAKLREPGRMAEFMKTGKTTPADAGAQLPNVTVPALIIMGTLDPDFADPRAEGDAIVAALPSGLGTVAMVEGAGHYPHAQSPDQVAALVIGFLKERADAWAGLTGDNVVASAAGLADEIGFQGVTMGLLAGRLGIRAPSLYKHVDGLADLQHRLATLAMTELGEVIRDALQGKAGRDAVAAMMTAVRAYVDAHPGRYAATVGAEFTGPDDPLLAAGTRVINSVAAVLRGYGIAENEMNHAIRTLRSTMHGFAMLEASRGFQWDADPDESFEWLIGFIDRGLRPGGS